MNILKYTLIAVMVCTSLSCREKVAVPKAYYISVTGSDNQDGSKGKPWKTINRAHLEILKAGDTIFLAGGETFESSLVIDSLMVGTGEQPVVITSDAANPATVNSGNGFGLWLEHTQHIKIEHLKFTGSGRKTGNTHPGVYLTNCRNVSVNNLDIQGYQKAGLHIHDSYAITAGYVNAHDNGYAGILVTGEYGRKDASRNIHIHDCVASNNPGDPTELDNHSGNGILVGYSTQVVVEYCTATGNGWDMPRTGNGPVGIWAFESDSVLIQYCIAYRNRTQKGAADGGGFDLDGGMTNSTIQYCLSYENEGSAFGLFQYAGASDWYNNTIRYCISENDGSVSAAQGAIFIWNSSGDPEQLKDCYVYNNTIYNEKGSAISYEAQSANNSFHFCNNIFVVKDKFIQGTESSGIFEANNWYSLSPTKQTPKGTNNISIDPRFRNSGKANLTDPRQLQSFDAYQLPDGSPLKTSGIDLKQRFGWSTVNEDFNGHAALMNGIGACH